MEACVRVLMHTKKGAKTGKQKFLNRLADEFPNHGVEVVTDPDKNHDVYLAAKYFKWKTKKPKVLRMNGCYHDLDKPYKKMNEELAVQCRKADGIIYQSQFCLDMHRKYVGTYKNVTVIFNGAPLNRPCDRTRFPGYVSAVARWRPHKRRAPIEVSAALADTYLWVGDGSPDRVVDGRFFASYSSIHLAWIDWCPNSVVEALTIGCPVITNNVGGTQELIKEGCGKILEIDEPYDMKPVHLYKPPAIDHKIVADAIKESKVWPRVTNNWHVDIRNIAAQYKEFLYSVM